MNPSPGPHHKIWTTSSSDSKASLEPRQPLSSRREDGYTLVALLAVMTVLALFAAAAAPSIRQQAQREREIEAIFRGEQVADAIGRYYSAQRGRSGTGDGALPTSMDQLLEGIPSGTKKVQILRPSAARELLSDSGEWQLVRPRTAALADFQRSLILFAHNTQPTTNDPQLKQIEQLMAPPVLATLGIATTSSSSIGDVSASGPFIGVASESKNKAVINYYGIDQHNQWIFTPLFR